MRRLPPVLAMLLLATVAATADAQFDNVPAGGAPLDKAATQQWQVGVKIQAVGGPCGSLFGTIPVPTNWPEQQVKVIHEDISPTVRRVTYREEGGIRQMLFEIPVLPAGEVAKALITFEVTKSSQAAPTDTSGYVIPSKLPRDFYKYLGPSPFIESTHRQIKNVAREMTEGKEGAWAQVEALYDGCRDRVKIDHDKLKGALAALRDGKAEKEDVASLFVALCRAHKVPARMVWVPDYVYAEFYLADDKGEGHWFPCQIEGDKEFGFLTDKRPILQKGDNMRVPEKKEAQRFVAEYLTGKGGNGGHPVVEFVRRLDTGMP